RPARAPRRRPRPPPPCFSPPPKTSRDLPEALKRRCLYLYIDYPAPERERDIVLSRVPGLDVTLAGQVAGVVRSLRQLELKKRPSVSETIDWARTLSLLGAQEVSTDLVVGTLH